LLPVSLARNQKGTFSTWVPTALQPARSRFCREADEGVKALKPWVRAVVTVWVLAAVPFLLFGLAMLIYNGPWVLASAWDSFFVQYDQVTSALGDGRVLEGVLGMINVASLVIPVIGGTLIFAWVCNRLVAAVWNKLGERPVLRAGLATAVMVTASIVLYVWWPKVGDGSIGSVLTPVVVEALAVPAIVGALILA